MAARVVNCGGVIFDVPRSCAANQALLRQRKGPQGPAGPRGEAGLPGPPGNAGIRQVQQDCVEDRDCLASCAEDEIAINAFCPKKAPAVLNSLREISCGSGNQFTMVAFCAK